MLKNIFIFFSLLTTSFSYAQQQKVIDSLLQEEVQQKGIAKIKTLNELSWQLRKSNDSTGIRYALKALELSQEQNYYLGISDAYNRLGSIAKHQKKIGQAKKYYNKALSIDEKQNYKYGIARANNQLGIIYKDQENLVNAIDSYKNSLNAFEKIKKHKQAAKVATNLGALYLHYNKKKEALQYYLKALNYSKLSKNRNLIAKSLKKLGLTQKKLQNYKEALAYFKKATSIYEEENNLEEIANTQIAIATMYDYLNKNELSKKTFIKSLRFINQNNQGDKGSLCINFATLYKKLGQRDSALYYYKKSIGVFKKSNNNKNLLVAYNNIGNLYSDTKNHKEALTYLKQSLTLQHQVKDSSMLALTYTSIAKVYIHSKNYALAYQYKDSSYWVTKKEYFKIKAADRYEVAYINEKKKLEAAVHQQKIAEANTEKKNSYIFALIVAIILMTGLFFYAIKARKQKQKQLIMTHEREIQNQQIQTLISTQEMQAFDAMITGEEKERKRIAEDLHDNFSSKLALIKILYQSIGNNLTTEANSNYKKANTLLDEACKDIREISHKMLSGTLANFGLVPALKELQQNIESVYAKQHEKQIQINITFHKLDFRLDNGIEIQIYRVLQELLTNIIKHAHATQVDIQLLKLSDTINIIVEDNGIGFNTVATHKGVGLKNIHSRIITKLKGDYHIDSGKGNGTTFAIDIPIKNTNSYEN